MSAPRKSQAPAHNDPMSEEPISHWPIDATLPVDSQVAPPAQPASSDLRIPGYVLTHQIGVGAYGQVWQAVRIGAGNDVAVKVFTAPEKLDWRYLQREVDRLLRVAEHPHIVTLFDANFQNVPPFYSMALMRRGALSGQSRAGQQFQNIEQAAEWFEQIVSALVFAHGKGLLHCDLKPGNVLLDEESNVRLVDFGQSHLQGEAANRLGTLYYMPPEQAIVAGESSQPPDPTVSWDIYGVGATIYALLTGSPPYAEAALEHTLTSIHNINHRLNEYRSRVQSSTLIPIRQINGKVDRDFADIVEHCLVAHPQDRYSSVSELANDLQRRREGRPLRCHPPTWRYRTKKLIRRNLGIFTILFVATIALSTVVVTGLYKFEEMRERLISEKREVETRLQIRERENAQLREQLEQLEPQNGPWPLRESNEAMP